jgi:hypothetical protein
MRGVKMAQNTKKKPYEKPHIQSEKIIETAALACGKCAGGNPIYKALCKGFTKKS